MKKVFLSIFIILAIGLGITAYLGYKTLVQPNVSLEGKKSRLIYIPTGSDFNQALSILNEEGILLNTATFEWLAERKGYKKNIRPGRYRVLAEMGNRELINLLMYGNQEKVKFTLNMIRTREQLASRVSGKLEADSAELVKLLNDDDFLSREFGMGSSSILTMFIPDTYEFYWNTSAEQFLQAMAEKYKSFWTGERKEKARKLGLSQTEVAILASIVEMEQLQFTEERPVIAGLYLNRLRIGMPLQSDPTILYILGDYSIKRVLNQDRRIESPYNTYLNKGLPPGPICLPSTISIDAVLNFKPGAYMYMCAKEDMSGRHYFTTTYAEHRKCAIKYHRALDKLGIMR